MKFIHNDENGYHLDAYLDHLISIEDRLPPGACEYALAPWRFDISDHRCPHDSWLNSISILEIPVATTKARIIEMHAIFQGAYHDGFLEFIWRDVRRYSLSLETVLRNEKKIGHEDWIIDELLIDDSGIVSHEIEFSRSGHWNIHCKEIIHVWRSGSDKL